MQNDKNIIQENLIDETEQIENNTPSETVEFIELDELEIVDVDLQNAFPALGEPNEDQNHSLLNGRDLPDQHPIKSIIGLDNELTNIKALKRHIYASQNGLSEFRKWKDNNPDGDDRTGYFVKLVSGKNGVDEIDICKTTDDVYGVAVKESGFVGGQSNNEYSDEWRYVMVGIAGALRVRTDGTSKEGDYVVPNSFGEATKSDNKCGYKVISHGTYPSYPYVTIAVIPQNDKLSKIYKDLTNVGNNVGNITIKLENINDKINDVSDKINININDTEGLKNALEDTQNIINNAVETANKSQEKANKAMETAQSARTESINKIEEAQNIVRETLEFKNVMNVFIDRWSDDKGTDLTAILRAIDNNGASIQHLVSHINKYAVGDKSLSDGLTEEEVGSVLTDEYIYVPTNEHNEIMPNREEITFELGYAYRWNIIDKKWEEPLDILTSSEYQNGRWIGDLWYCWTDVIQEENVYIAGTLYRWGENQEWIAVAKNNVSPLMISLVKQSADKIQSVVTDLDGKTTSIEQGLKSIAMTVSGGSGDVSSIEQTSETIATVISNNQGALSSLQTSVNDNAAQLITLTAGNFCTIYQSLIGAINPYEGEQRYSSPPQWKETEGYFSFEGMVSNENGIYFFYSDDKTKYVKITSDDTYEIYTIGNRATSTLQSRITDTEAMLNGVAAFATGDSDAISGIYSNASTSKAVTDFLTSYYRHQLLSVSEGTVEGSGGIFLEPPTWNVIQDRYEFNMDDYDIGGSYYFPLKDGSIDNTRYCKLVTVGDKTLTEIYGTTVSSLASISQKTDENGASIGMIVQNGEVQGSILVDAINDRSTIRINADKIGINGVAVFTDNLNDGTTTISGNYIRTGVINSNNYSIKSNYNVSSVGRFKIENKKIMSTESDNDILWYCQINVDDLYLLNPSLSNGEYYRNTDGCINNSSVQTMRTIPTSGQIYVIANHYFDVLPQNGMRINLTHGTIATPNFSIDNRGNAFFQGEIRANSGVFQGEIRATSGYIGNEIGGFKIKCHSEWTCNEELIGGTSYCFKLNGKYYSFTAPTLSGNTNSYLLKFTEDGTLTYNGTEIEEYTTNNTKPSSSELITLEDSGNGLYYIEHNQTSLQGNNSNNPGIYMAPDGIGLGNGKFWIDSTGDVWIHGNLTLDGSVTWGASSSPVNVLYHTGSNYGRTPPTEKPNKTYRQYSNTGTDWHKNYVAGTDYYASYTYDGGKTWTESIKIRGSDGRNGSDGSDAVLNEDSVFDILTNNGETTGIFPFSGNTDKTQLYINATYINSGTLKGVDIEGCKYFCDGDGEDGVESFPSAYYVTYGVANNTAQTPIIKGYLCYGSGGKNDGTSSAERVLLGANVGVALKIFTNADSQGEGAQTKNISIGAGIYSDHHTYSGRGRVIFDSPVTFRPLVFDPSSEYDVEFNNCRVNFTGATVTGLYAKFA